MKLLIVGTFAYDIYEQVFLDAWKEMGLPAAGVALQPYFQGFLGKVQAYVPFGGPATHRANEAIKQSVLQERPDVLLVWRGTHVTPSTFRFIRQHTDATLVSYNNDDPFGPRTHGEMPRHHNLLWRWYIESLALVDLALVYRPVNVGEAMRAGAKRAAVMKPSFIPERDRPVTLDEAERARFACDVVFVGHYEPDHRVACLAALAEAGLHVRLFGGGAWNRERLGKAARAIEPGPELHGDDYTRALCGARMALCFLSKLNRDVYTRRCFEIPASGALLLSERSPELLDMFRENEEAVFFSNPAELVEKARWLRDSPATAKRIAAAGRRRVLSDGHSVRDRAAQFLEMVGHLRREPEAGLTDDVALDM